MIFVYSIEVSDEGFSRYSLIEKGFMKAKSATEAVRLLEEKHQLRTKYPHHYYIYGPTKVSKKDIQWDKERLEKLLEDTKKTLETIEEVLQ